MQTLRLGVSQQLKGLTTMFVHNTRVSRRGLLGIGAAGLSAAALSACSGPSTSGETTNEESGPRDYSGVKPAAEIEFWSVHPGHSVEVETELVKQFNSSQPDTKVKLVTGGASYADINQKFQTAQASNSLPGVLTLAASFWFVYYLNRTIVDLKPLVKAAEVDVSDYMDTLWKDYTYDDKQWLVPYGRSTPLFYYNKDHFKKAGLPDRGPKTWMEFADWAKKLKSADTGAKIPYGLAKPSSSGSLSWAFANKVWGWGGQYSKEFDYTMEASETVAAIEWVRKGVFDGKWIAISPQSNAGDFGAGASSATVASTGGLRGILESAQGKFEVGTAFLPGGPKETDDICPTGGAGLAIPSGIEPEEQVAAMNFIKFMTNPENTVKFSKATGYMPLRKSADVAPLISGTPQIKTALDQLSHTRLQDYARTMTPGGPKMMDDGLLQVLTKQDADVQKVMTGVDEQMTKVYERDVKPDL